MLRPALLALALLAAASPAGAQNRDQDDVLTNVDEGVFLPFPAIRRNAQRAARGGTYLGSDFDRRSAIYRFKFIRQGSVTWVDVDARSGAVLGVMEGR